MIFKRIKNVFYILWQRHHLIIPPKYWKRYLNSIFRKCFGPKRYYNPFIVKEYNKWISKQKYKKEKKIKYEPLISFIIPVYNIESDFLRDCLDSILLQTYSNFEICLADDHSTKEETLNTLKEYERKDSRIKVKYRMENGHISKATNTALDMATGEYIALMDDDDILTTDALYSVVQEINEHRDADFIYSDEDKQDINGNYCEPHFKSDFAEDTFYGGNYVCHFTVIKKELLDKVGGLRHEYIGAQDFDLFLRCTEQAKKICHIPKILYHWRKVPGSTADTIENKDYAIENGKKAVEDALKRRNVSASVLVPIKTTNYVVEYKVKNNYMVTIIMLDNTKKTINHNIKQIKNLNYKNIEIIVNYPKLLDNDKIIFSNDKDINSLINNANGEYILIISGKVSFNDNDLISKMIGYASQKSIGVVGPKIYNYAKTVKSAGLVLSNEYIYKDAFANYFTDSYGIYGRLLVPYNYSALSDVFFMFEKKKYEKTTGFMSDIDFSLSTIDLCLQMIKNNYRNVLLSHLYVFQNDNKRKLIFDVSEEDKNKLRALWNLDNDKYYNKNLSKKYPFMLEVEKK